MIPVKSAISFEGWLEGFNRKTFYMENKNLTNFIVFFHVSDHFEEFKVFFPSIFFSKKLTILTDGGYPPARGKFEDLKKNQFEPFPYWLWK